MQSIVCVVPSFVFIVSLLTEGKLNPVGPASPLDLPNSSPFSGTFLRDKHSILLVG